MVRYMTLALLLCVMGAGAAHAQLVTDDQKISELEGRFARDRLDDGDLFGGSVSALGDVDGDGVTDLAVGAYFDDDGGINRGAVWVLFFQADGTVKRHQKISDTEGGFTGMLDDAGRFGGSVSALGDLDGDGVVDLAVGAYLDDDGGSRRGAVWVLFLQADGTVKRHQKISDTEGGFTGMLDDGDFFGRTVSSLGDLNGDGVTDLAVGAFFDDDGGADRGAVWVLFLQADGTVKRHQKISDTEGGFTGMLDDGDFFGDSVSALGDVDGDGVVDLAVGTPEDDDGGVDRGAVWVLFLNEPPVVVETMLETSVPTLGQVISVSARVNDENSVARVAMSFRVAGDPDYLSKDMNLQPDGSYLTNIPAFAVSPRGIEYFITATDDTGANARLPEEGIFSIPVFVPNPGVLKITPQPGGSEQTAYRLISIPLDLQDKTPRAILEDDLGAYNDTQWRFFELTPAPDPTQDDLIELFDVSEMPPGKAFYLIVKDGVDIISTGVGTSVRTDSLFKILLEPGWTLIGNPFNFNIPATNLRWSDGSIPDLSFLDGAWRNLPDTAAIEPFEGYAVFNFSNAPDTLFINPDLSATLNTGTSKRSIAGKTTAAWSIRILAQSQQARDVDNFAAVVAGASETWDRLDRAEPPPIGDYVSVYFHHPEWQKNTARFSTDARPEPTDGVVWSFDITTTVRDKVHLSFEGLADVPPAFDIWLVDDVVQTAQNLRETPTYTVAGTTDPRSLKLVVGKPGFLEGELAESREIPTRFELFPTFPNPFNPSTTIRYGLPEASPVSLIVYNLLGQQVATLETDTAREAGYHAVVWDGRSDAGTRVASGVYFVRMQAGPFMQTQRMVLVK